jgi:hypothetical protein
MSDTNAILPPLTGDAQADYFEGLFYAALEVRERQLLDALRRLAEVESIAREYRSWHEGDCGMTRTLPEIATDFDRLLPPAPTETP